MKQLLFTFIIVTSISVTGQNQKTYQLNTTKSIINWKGSYSFSFSDHNGTVHFSKGKLITTDDKITGGEFIINMTTIDNEDNRERGHGPVAHLKNPDFFYVEKFPEAKLAITSATYHSDINQHRFEAELTIKGITQLVQFMGNADSTTNLIKAKLKLDRTLWGINYNNKLKNEAISDVMEFDAKLYF